MVNYKHTAGVVENQYDKSNDSNGMSFGKKALVYGVGLAIGLAAVYGFSAIDGASRYDGDSSSSIGSTLAAGGLESVADSD